MHADVVDVDGLFLSVFHAAHDIADAGLAARKRAEARGIGQERSQELDGHNFLPLVFHGIDARHAHVLENGQMIQIAV